MHMVARGGFTCGPTLGGIGIEIPCFASTVFEDDDDRPTEDLDDEERRMRRESCPQLCARVWYNCGGICVYVYVCHLCVWSVLCVVCCCMCAACL